MSALSSPSSSVLRLVRCARLSTSRPTTVTTKGTSGGATRSSTSSARLHNNTKNHQQQQENIFSKFNNWYFEKLETHPLLTKCLTGGIIAGCGDIICQFGSNRTSGSSNDDDNGTKKKEDQSIISFLKNGYDPMRTVHFFIMGSCFASPLNHFWYNYLQSSFGGHTFAQITKRVVLDQFIWCPAWTVVWLACFWTMEGSQIQDIPYGLKENYVGIITANWYLWIPAQYVNFYAVPLHYKVLYTNFVELIWNAYLSFATASSDSSEPDDNSNKNQSSDTKNAREHNDDEKEKEKDNQRKRAEHRRRTQTLHRNRTFR